MEPCELQNELVSAEGRNRKAVLCQRCGSRVLQPGTALFSRRQLFLPSMRKKPDLADGSNPDGDVYILGVFLCAYANVVFKANVRSYCTPLQPAFCVTA
uniref:Uncharacterized protein n=1 Tax=Mus musculus TaxID=10090 RepID=Q3TMQ8_MOUSE|nr:unnamed protein product [Mus musculus]